MTLAARLVWLATGALAALPLARSRQVGAVLGSALWLARTRARRTTETNLSLCFPELDDPGRAALARRSLIESGKTFAEFGALWRWEEARLARLIECNQAEPLLQAAHAQGRGVIALTPHFGNWELLCFVLRRLPRVAILYEPPNLAGMDHYLRGVRERWGLTSYPPTRGGLKGVYRTLREGGIVGLLPDQVPPWSAGVHAPFFGVSALTMTLVQRLAARTGAPVIMGAARRAGAGFCVDAEVLDDTVRSHDPVVSAATVNRAVERIVLRDPAQYHWEYKRFRRQPDRGDFYRHEGGQTSAPPG